jgi:hypothetical protein
MVIRTPILWTDPGVLRSSGAKEPACRAREFRHGPHLQGGAKIHLRINPWGLIPRGEIRHTPEWMFAVCSGLSRWLVKMALNFR